jgi:glycosyltransferase involved in cell wall biosynthesis
MWNGKTVSVVLMTYAERDSIREVIDGFLATGLADEVLVVDNNAEPGTREEVAKTSARLVEEPRQGYGFATRRGLMDATGDLIVLAEPDGTFLPEDLVKLLAYSNECEVVFGTRTTRELIWVGANMSFFLRWGNWAVAKLIEVLFNTSHLSDVGCTYRLLRRGVGGPRGREHDGRRQSRRRRGHDADGRLRGPVRRGPGQLPPASRRLVRHRPLDPRDRGRAADDPAGAALPAQHPQTAGAGAGVRARPLGAPGRGE